MLGTPTKVVSVRNVAPLPAPGRLSLRPQVLTQAAHFPLSSHDSLSDAASSSPACHRPHSTTTGNLLVTPTTEPLGPEQCQHQQQQDAESRCPFLASLRKAPMMQMSYRERVQLQVFDPANFQEAVLSQRDSDTIVQGPKAPLFSAFHMLATYQLVKDLFTAEAAGDVTQGLSEAGGYRAFATLLGEDSLLVVKDPERHKQLRVLMAPAFSADAIATYLPDIQALVSCHLSRWQDAGDAGVKAHKEMKRMAFQFIMQVVMGHSISEADLSRLSGLFSSLTAGLTAWPYMDLPFTSWRRALQARDELVAYFQSGVTAARCRLEDGEAVSGVLGMLVAAEEEQGAKLTDSEITSNLLLVLLAGHDTSSTTLTRCISNLQDHPWVVQQLRDEQQSVMTKHGGVITAAALKDMPFAEAVIRETLRRDPVVGTVMRVTTTDIALGGYSLPKSTMVMVPLRYMAVQDPRWKDMTGDLDPAAFNPNRLLTPEGAKSGQLMPFGAGARYCIGAGLAMAEMKIFLALLARSFEFSADNNTEWKAAIGYFPANGLPMVVRALSHQAAATT